MRKRTEKSLWKKIRSLVLTLGLVLLAFGDGTAFATTVYVDDDAADGGGGTSWADARNSLADALSAAIPAEGETIEIWVASGTYRPTESSSDREASFVLKDGVALYGGFAGDETTSADRDPAANVTVLTGDIDRNDTVDELGVTASADQIVGNNSYHVVTALNVDDTAVLDGFTVTGGKANGGVLGYYGGGMYVKDTSSLTVRNCVFCGNAANWKGAGIHSWNSLPTVEYCTFRDNRARKSGGGMFNDESPAVVRNCVFSRNAAGYGGGMSNSSANLKPEVTDCIFIGNCATSDLTGGGGMYNSTSSTVVTNCTFAGNRAPKGAGMTNQSDANPRVENCTFYENVADDLGGGVYNCEKSSPVLVNCTFDKNGAATGAGMYSKSSRSSCRSMPYLSNCLLWDGEGGEVFNDEFSKPTLEYCLVRGGDAGTGSVVSGDIISGDPLLGPLADNESDIRCGAPGEERTIQTLSLGLGSPAIDAGLAAKAPSVDQRGESRPQGHGYDMGAFEFDEWYVLAVSGDVGGKVSVSRYGEVSGDCPVMSGDVLSVEAIPDDGWTFEHWSDDLDGISNPVTVTMDGNKTVTVNFAPRTFTVTFTAGEHGSLGGELSQTVSHGSDCLTVTAVPDEGYSLVNWTDDKGTVLGTDANLTLTNVTKNRIVTANFAISKYSVTFTAGEHGSLGGKLSQTVSYGSDCSTVKAVADEGYSLVNWTDDKGTVLGTDANLALTNVTKNRNVKANFSIDKYSVTFTAGEHGSLGGELSQTVPHGSDCLTVKAVADEGYSLVDWTDDKGTVLGTDANLALTNVTESRNVKANFSIDKYSVTFTAGEHGSLTGELSQTVPHGSDCLTVKAVADESYSLINWTDDKGTVLGTDVNLILTDVTESRSVKANFAIDKYSVTFTAGEHGSLGGELSQTVPHGSDCLTVKAVADEGYSLVDWTDDRGAVLGTDANLTLTNVTKNRIVTATFAIDKYSVTFTAGEHGSLTGELSQTVPHGSDCLTVKAVADESYSLINWTDDKGTVLGTDANLILTNVTKNRIVTANFAISKYSVTFTAGEHGSLTGELSQTVPHGSDCLTVKAVADEGYSLVDWTDDRGAVLGTDVNLTLANVTKDLTITAHFSSIPSVSSITPSAGAIGVQPDVDICVIFDWNITAGAKIGDLSIGGAKQKLSGIGGRVEGAVLRVPHAALTERNSVYTVIIPAGAVRSSDGVENAEIRWSFTTVSDETDVIAFGFSEQHGPAVIEVKTHIIRISVNGSETSPRNSAASLAPAIEVSRGATVSPVSGEARNFTSPVVYTVTAEDGVTKTDWTAVVTVLDGTSTIESDAFDVASPEGEMYGRIGAKEGGTPLDFRLSVKDFLAGIESGAEGQILEVIDSEGCVRKESERIRPGDLLRVTAADGSTSIYVIDAKYLIYLEVGEGGCVSVACEYGGDLEPDGDGYLAVEPECVITFTVNPDEKWRIDELLYNSESVSEGVLTKTSGGYEFKTEPVNRNGAFSVEFAREQEACPAVPVLVSPDVSASNCDLAPLLSTEAYEASGAGEHGETRWEIASDDAFTQVVFDVRTHRYLTEIRTGRDVLSPGRTYHWRVRFFDDDGTPSAWSDSRSFTTVEAKKAGLDNGVPSAQVLSADEEILISGEWDVSNVSADCKIFRGATEGEQIGIRAQAGSGAIEQAESLPKEVLSDDMGTGDLLELPRGLVSFRIRLDASDIAGSASVRVHFSSPLPPELRHWYKYSEGDGWTDYSDRAVFAADGSWVDLELRDGGEGDADGLANAVIVDPGGPGKSTISDSGCGHGCDVFGSMPDAVLLLVPFAFLLGRKR